MSRSAPRKRPLAKPVEVGNHLIVHPRVCFGKLTFKGTRVPVQTVLNRIAKGRSMKSILASWPEVSREAIEEAVKLAAEALIERSGAKADAIDEPVRSGRSA